MQSARNFVGVLVEFPAGVELRHNDLSGRDAFTFVDVGWNAAAVVTDGAGAVRIEYDRYFLGKTGKRFVDRVVDGLIDHVMQAGAIISVADIHSGPFANGIEPLEHLDRFCIVIGRWWNLPANGFGHVGLSKSELSKSAFESVAKNLCLNRRILYTKKAIRTGQKKRY